MLTAQQVGSFAHLSFNTGMANALPSKLALTSINRKKEFTEISWNLPIVSERELTFICCRPSVCRLSVYL